MLVSAPSLLPIITIHAVCFLFLQPGGGEGGEDKPKKFKKADLGESNKMYYNEEVWRVVFTKQSGHVHTYAVHTHAVHTAAPAAASGH